MCRRLGWIERRLTGPHVLDVVDSQVRMLEQVRRLAVDLKRVLVIEEVRVEPPVSHTDQCITIKYVWSRSEVSFVDVHHGTVGMVNTVGEAEALVEASGREVRGIDADIHCDGTALSGVRDSCLHQRPSQSLPPSCRYNVKLSQVTLKATAPDRVAKAKHCQSVGTVTRNENRGITALDELSQPSR